MAVKRGLGKGLDSLIPNKMEDETKKAAVTAGSKEVSQEDGPVTIVNITKVEILMRMLWRNWQNLLSSMDYYSRFLFRTARPIMRLLPVNVDGVLPKKQV